MRNKILVLSIILLGATLHTTAQTTNHQAYSIFVFGLARYMSWPATGQTEFVVAVVGKSKVYDEMVKTYTGRQISGLPVKVIQVEDAASLTTPQIVYVSDNKSSIIDDLKKHTEGKGVLIIAEREGLHKKGAGMSFIAIDNKLRLDMNSQELHSRQIKVSAQLNALANEVL